MFLDVGVMMGLKYVAEAEMGRLYVVKVEMEVVVTPVGEVVVMGWPTTG